MESVINIFDKLKEDNFLEACASTSPSGSGSYSDPRKSTLEAHDRYYSHGTYDTNRLQWTIEHFLPALQGAEVLEVGCGDGAMLQLLSQRGAKATGLDASSSGIKRCAENGLDARCIDVSSEGIPFPDKRFDIVVSLETFEHLTNPYLVLEEVARVLKAGGKFVCSVPNPLTGHPYLYPGLFEYKHFRRFLKQGNMRIARVLPWEWAPRETILPAPFRSMPIVSSRIIAGGIRKVIEKAYLTCHAFPAFCYWLWTFECYVNEISVSQFQRIASSTMPGSDQHF